MEFWRRLRNLFKRNKEVKEKMNIAEEAVLVLEKGGEKKWLK